MDTLTAAKAYATQKHAGQLYGVVPYTHHLQAVAQSIMTFNFLDEVRDFKDQHLEEETGIKPVVIAAWLHDILEDTRTKKRDIEELFGEYIAELVWAVTGERDLGVRQVRNAVAYSKIRECGPYAVHLKIHDRIANCQPRGASFRMYLKEYPGFRAALFDPKDATINTKSWALLDAIMDFNVPDVLFIKERDGVK